MLFCATANLKHTFVEANLLHARGVLFIVFRCVIQELPPTNSAQHNYSADHDSRSDRLGPSIGSRQTFSANPSADSSQQLHRACNGGIWRRTMMRPEGGSGHAFCILARTHSFRREDCENYMLRGTIWIVTMEKPW